MLTPAEHEPIPAGEKYSNTQILFDGLNWFLTAGIERKAPKPIAGADNEIGIDAGVKGFVICGSGKVYNQQDAQSETAERKSACYNGNT